MTDVVKDGNERLANYLFLKPIALKEDPAGYVLPAQPLMVITERKGSLRHYQFLFQAQPAGGDPDYAVFFRYPNDADMQGAGEARERQRRAEAAQTRGLLRRETNLVSSTPGFDGSRNYRMRRAAMYRSPRHGSGTPATDLSPTGQGCSVSPRSSAAPAVRARQHRNPDPQRHRDRARDGADLVPARPALGRRNLQSRLHDVRSDTEHRDDLPLR